MINDKWINDTEDSKFDMQHRFIKEQSKCNRGVPIKIAFSGLPNFIVYMHYFVISINDF